MFTYAELFCGLGGLSQGFVQAGYRGLFATDIEQEQIETFSINHLNTSVLVADIRQLSSQDIMKYSQIERGQLDVLLGGPPCQGFSTYGKRRTDDERNQLFREFARVIYDLKPRAFVMENVIGLLSMEDGAVVQEIMRTFTSDLGYATTLMVLDAVNYGVPQFRRRVFFAGHRDGPAPTFPLPTHSIPQKNGRRRGQVQFRNSGEPYPSQMNLFGNLMLETISLESQEQYEQYLLAQSHCLEKPLTVRDAISDLPREALIPQDTDKAIDYLDIARTEYQNRMKGCSERLWNHAAKRHMLRRLIRTALIEQGDYGNVVRDRLFEKGVPEDIIAHVLEGTFTEEELRTIRDVDKGIERQILNLLKNGKVSAEEISGDIQSKGFANKYRRLHWDEPSHTLVAHMARDCSDFIHPELNRPITVREAARLQSFPDQFQFHSSHFRQLRGIGNAVPPLLAQAIADHLATELKYRR